MRIELERTSSKRFKDITERIKRSQIFKKTTIALSALAIAATEACATEVNPPVIPIEQLIAQTQEYANYDNLKTLGYPEKVGEKTLKFPIINTMSMGKSVIFRIDWVTTKKDTYNLHATSDPRSPSLEVIASGGSAYLPGFPIDSKGSNLVSTERYEVTGKIIKIKDKDGKNEKLVLTATKAVKEVASTQSK